MWPSIRQYYLHTGVTLLSERLGVCSYDRPVYTSNLMQWKPTAPRDHQSVTSSHLMTIIPIAVKKPSFNVPVRGGSKGWPRGPRLPWELWPLCPPNETGCKVAGLHNRCIHSVASRSWCQITPSRDHALGLPEFLAPKYRCGHPAGHPKLLQLETLLVPVVDRRGSMSYGGQNSRAYNVCVATVKQKDAALQFNSSLLEVVNYLLMWLFFFFSVSKLCVFWTQCIQ